MKRFLILQIAVTLFFAIAAFGPVTGAALNPARTFGPSILAKQFLMNAWWIYYVGPSIGGVLAALIYEFTLFSPEHDYTNANKEDTEGITSQMKQLQK